MKPAEEYILSQEEPYVSILLELKAFIEAFIPNVELQYKWKVPFYYLDKRPLFYLNQSKNYVDLGFWHDHLVAQHQHHFISEKRKVVKSLRFYSLNDINDINDDVLKDVIKTVAESDFHPFKRVKKNN